MKSNRKKIKKQTTRKSVPHFMQPPEYNNNTIVSRVFRFQYIHTNNGTQTSFVITPAKLGALQVLGTTTNTSATQLYEAIRVRKIEMWSSPPVDGSIVDISLAYAGSVLGTQGPNRTASAQTIGMTRPAYLSLSPGRTTQAAQWQSTSTSTGVQNFFTIFVNGTGTSGTVTVTLDLHCALRMTQDSRTTSNTVALTTVALTPSIILL